MSSTWKNHADVNIKNISRHISTCYSNQMVLRNTCETTKSCQTFQEIRLLQHFAGHLSLLRSQSALYFRVCSISRLFRCAMNINESVISITAPGSRHGKLTVRQCYEATDGICTEFQVVLYVDICRRHVGIFLPICRHEKDLDGSITK